MTFPLCTRYFQRVLRGLLKDHYTWYSSSSRDSRTAWSTLKCLSISPKDSINDFSWEITYSSPVRKMLHFIQTATANLKSRSIISFHLILDCRLVQSGSEILGHRHNSNLIGSILHHNGIEMKRCALTAECAITADFHL